MSYCYHPGANSLEGCDICLQIEGLEAKLREAQAQACLALDQRDEKARLLETMSRQLAEVQDKYEAATTFLAQENAEIERLKKWSDDQAGVMRRVIQERQDALLQVGLGKELAERVLECSSEVPISVKHLAFAFFGKPCTAMCCTQKRAEEKGVFCLEHKKVMVDGVCPKCPGAEA